MKKYIADWLEKISAGAALIGLFQSNTFALIIGFVLIFASLYLRREKR